MGVITYTLTAYLLTALISYLVIGIIVLTNKFKSIKKTNTEKEHA